jgi:hypothetical protein
MAIVYLDVDDEITSAAARIRSAADVDVALVLPAGSRIATSRINFRLLAREAAGHSRRLAIVAPEASARALAASAGLPVFASVVEFEDARRAAGDEGLPAVPVPLPQPPPDGAGTGTAIGAAVAAGGAIGAASVAGSGARPRPGVQMAVPAGPPTTAAADATATSVNDGGRSRGPVGPSTGLGAGPPVPPTRRRRWPLVMAVLLVIALLGGTMAAAGYVLLPTATVTLQLTAEPVGPVVFTGTADPDAVAVDADSATVPATRIQVPLSATGTFKATGKRVESSPATGQVRWTNCDPTRAYTIPQGTLARTGPGVAFATQEAIFLPVAILAPPRITCQNRTVAVRAVRDGPAGNVAPGTITVVPGQYNSVVIKVTNPAATSGGARAEFPKVTDKDVASAAARLTKQLDEELASVAASPPGVPAGSTAYPQTAVRGEPVPSEPLADIVGREVETFDLTMTADGTVVAADPSPLEQIGADRLVAEVPAGMELLEGSTRVDVGPGVPAGETIHYAVMARGQAVRDVTEDEVRAQVKGLTPAAAERLLAPYGTADVVVWPSWVTTITTVDARLTVTVEGVPPVAPSPTPSPAPTVGPTSGTTPSSTPPASPAGSGPRGSAAPSGSAAP